MGKGRRSLEERVTKSAPHVLTKPNYGVCISWECLTGKQVDLDLQAVIVDERGLVVDAVYYNNLVAMHGAIGHTGDAVKHNLGFTESIWVRFPKLPKQVALIIFVVTATDGSRLRDADNGVVYLCEQSMCKKVRQTKVEKSMADADVVAIMKKLEDGSWAMYDIDEPAEGGSHFIDILEPTIGNLIRAEIPHAPLFQKVAFMMDKGDVADFPETAKLRRLAVGVGAELKPGIGKPVDIDISAHFYSHNGKNLGQVDADVGGMHGVEHSGDTFAGDRPGADDEAITIDLMQVPHSVGMIFLLLTVRDGTFESVERPYARVVDQTATELLHYDVTDGQNMDGLVIGRLLCSPGKRWAFQAHGKYYHNSTKSWAAARKEMENILKAEGEATAAATQALVVPTSMTARSNSASLLPRSKSKGGASSPEGAVPRRSRVMTVSMGGGSVGTDGLMSDAEDGDVLSTSHSCYRRGMSCESSNDTDRAVGPNMRASARSSTIISRGMLRISMADLGEVEGPDAVPVWRQSLEDIGEVGQRGLLKRIDEVDKDKGTKSLALHLEGDGLRGGGAVKSIANYDDTASTVRTLGDDEEEERPKQFGACGVRCAVSRLPFLGACMSTQI